MSFRKFFFSIFSNPKGLSIVTVGFGFLDSLNPKRGASHPPPRQVQPRYFSLNDMWRKFVGKSQFAQNSAEVLPLF
jgi:hypothetical protein